MAVLALGLAGCGPAQQAAPPSAQAGPVAPSLPAPVSDELGVDGLRARAEAALRAQRIHAPAGESAVDYYLALRDRSPGTNGVSSALTELQPYVLIAAEQALASGELDQTRRLLALIARMDAAAPALPRLREDLRLAQERADRAEGARPAEVARRAALPVPAVAAPVQARPVDARVPVVAAAPASPAVAHAAPDAPIAPPRTGDAPAAPRAAIVRDAAPLPLPRLIADAAPRYPLSARNRRIEGSVLVAFTIRPDGSVGEVRPVSAQPAGVFEDAALAAAARWRFEATGRSVQTTRTLTFRLPADAKG